MTTDLFRCYAQDCAIMPSAAGTELSCPIMGAQYSAAHLKFKAAQLPANDAPALFVVRIKSNSFTEYPNPNNIDAITGEMREYLAQYGVLPVGEPKLCWRATPNDNWMNDHVDYSEHVHYEDIMPLKTYQVCGGEALVAFEIPADQRAQLPALKQAIDDMVKQRNAERGTRYA